MEAGGVEADELADRLRVLGDAVEVAGVLPRDGPAVAGGHRIDEHQVGDVEQRLAVVRHAVWRGRRPPLVLQHHLARTEGAEVEPDRRGARAAVEGVGDRPLPHLLDAVAGVGGEEDRRLRLAVLVAQDQGAGGGRVADVLAADHRVVLGGDAACPQPSAAAGFLGPLGLARGALPAENAAGPSPRGPRRTMEAERRWEFSDGCEDCGGWASAAPAQSSRRGRARHHVFWLKNRSPGMKFAAGSGFGRRPAGSG